MKVTSMEYLGEWPKIQTFLENLYSKDPNLPSQFDYLELKDVQE